MLRFSFSLLFSALVGILITRTFSENTCTKTNICSCEMSDGSGTVALWPADGGKEGPSFKDIKEKDKNNSFDWNPCTPFTSKTQPARCKNVMVCQHANYIYTCGTKNTSFTVEGGNVIIEYGEETLSGKTRKTQITLKCEKSVKGKGSISSISEKTDTKTGVIIYTGEFISQYACPTQSAGGGGLSTGSILLIIFFPLVLVYIVGGLLINRYQRGIESVPEMCPNHSFWGDCPFLVKDGCVFTFTSLVSCCKSAYAKCNRESYASI